MTVKQFRNYEVSIWTLQDSFITVLKPLNLEFKGVIQDATITLQDDGVNNISFSIPMYIMHNGQQIENPLWYIRQNGNLIANLRKIKVIFNKFTSDERVFEFIITDVSDTHDGFTKICQVTGDGLAFNELGKQGYKITLSAKDPYNEAEDLAEQGLSAIINNNINYWIDKVLINSNWKYSIQMDWSAFDGIIDYTAKEYENLSETIRNDRNNTRENMGLRRRDTIYEDSYVSAWREENGKILPATIQGETEKFRNVEGSESNKYNLLQKIAEIFGVYIKFKYYYDDNYHIIDREVIFYNNFLNEDDIIDLTYKYDTQNLSRKLDANDVVTKMFIQTLDDESSPNGLVSIVDTTANKTGEDYILNFDYLHDINTISEEQYAAIEEFENQIGLLNKQIIPLDSEIIALEEELLDCEVKRDNADLEIQQADENISDLQEFLDNVKDGKENLEVIAINPAHVILTQNDNGTYKGRFETQYSGVIPGTIQVYKTYDSLNLTNPLTNKISSFSTTTEHGAVQYLTFASSVFPNESDKKDFFYATFSYRPTIEKENVQKEYQILANRQREIFSNMSKKIDGSNPLAITGTKEELGLTKYIAKQKEARKALYEQKQKIIADFENLMGPALREGNWQPEDEYSSYGETHEEIYQPTFNNITINGESGILKFIWDNDLFEDEEKNYYETGILQKKVYYPCIDLSQLHPNIFNKLQSKEFLSALNFTYKDNNNPHAQLNVLPIGSCCQLAFLREKNGNTILPVLMITDINDVEEITNEASSKAALDKIKEFSNTCISYVSVDNLLTTNPTIDNETIFSVHPDYWINNPYLYDIVYPRFEVNSDYLKTNTNELMISIYRENSSAANTVITYLVNLEEYKNYYILKKNSKMYITLKPESLFLGKVGEAKVKVNFSISNTALQIYLDGIKIMKENAYPKVSYDLSNLLSENLIYNTYDRLGQLAHINDYELKLDNVMGYISAVTLNLDNPWQDSITIQNYKNKFEDLFSSIVAQTESMQQNSYKLGVVLNSFSADGKLTCALDDLSLLSSTQVLNSLIKNNADVIAAKTISVAAKDKAILASTDIYRVMHGEVGLQFQGNAIKKVTLNKDKGLLLEGYVESNDPSIDINSAGKKTPVFFNVTNNQMGFYRGEYDTFVDDCDNYNNNPANFLANKGYVPEPLLAFEGGNLALSGIIYAKNGWFGDQRGWIIGEGLTSANSGKLTYTDSNGNKVTTTISDTDLGGLLFSANGRVIFTTGTDSTKPKIILSKNGFPNITTASGKADALFLFDGDNLYINGNITAAAGNIGGWTIGTHYLGNATTQALSRVGIASGKDGNESSQRFSFWAGGAYNATPKFSVSPGGDLISTSGKIANWSISAGQLSSGTGNTYVALNSENTNNYAIWAGNATASSAPFSVTKAGALTATSGTIANWNINNFQLNSGSGNTYVALNSGASNVTGGSDYAFWAGNTTASSAPFSVTKAGVLKATSATIEGTIRASGGLIGGTLNSNGTWSGGWTIIAGAIYNGPSSLGAATKGLYLGTDGISGYTDSTHYFKFTKGTLSATGVTISGALTASTLSTGERTGTDAAKGTYIHSDGAIYGGQNKFTVTSEGYLTSTSGQIANWNISNYQLDSGSGTTYVALNSGASNVTGGSSYAIWAGSTNPASANFSVTKDGLLTSKSLYVGSNDNFLTYNSNGLTVKGSITATSLTVGNSNTMTYSSDNGLKIGTGNNYLQYKNSELTIKGNITATSGSFTGAIYATSGHIGGTYNNNSWTGGWEISNNVFYGKFNDNGTDYINGLKTNGTYAFAVGVTDPDHWNTGAFRVTHAGKMYANGAVITGPTTINTSGEIKISNSETSFNFIPTVETETIDDQGITIETTTMGKLIISLKSLNASIQSFFKMTHTGIRLYTYDTANKKTMGKIALERATHSYSNTGLASNAIALDNIITIAETDLSISNINLFSLGKTDRINIGENYNATTNPFITVYSNYFSLMATGSNIAGNNINLISLSSNKGIYISSQTGTTINGDVTINGKLNDVSLSDYIKRSDLGTITVAAAGTANLAAQAMKAILIDGGGKDIRVYASSNDTPPTKAGNENRILWLHSTGHKDFVTGQDSSGNNITERWAVVECLWKTV